MKREEAKDLRRELCPISIYDVAAVESWLEDLARRGERPVGFLGQWVCLEPDEPRTCRFRLEPLRRRGEEQDPERLAAYADLGWQLVDKLQGVFWVWRCDDPSAPDLDTDPVVQGEGYRYLKQRMVLRTAGAAAFWLACMAVLLLRPGWTSLWRELQESSWLSAAVQPVLGLALMVTLPVEIFLDARNTWRVWRTLVAGIPLERPKAYRRQLRQGRAVFALTMAVLALNVIVNFLNLGGPVRSGWEHTEDILDRETGRIPTEAVTVSLAELDGAEPVWFSADKKSLPLAPEMYYIRQSADLPGGERAAADTEYYRLRTAGLAERLAEEIVQGRPGSLGVAPFPATEGADSGGALDGFWFSQRLVSGVRYQYAVALLGREVLAVEYNGTADLREEGAYFAALLAE